MTKFRNFDCYIVMEIKSTFSVWLCLLVSQTTPTQATKPPRLEKIYSTVTNYARKYPGITKLSVIGSTYERRPIYALRIHNHKSGKAYRTMVVTFGIHAREYQSHASGLFVMRMLITNDKFKEIISKVRWFIIPVLNPDGYHYATTKDSLWRKNRRPLPGSKCFGVDLNRNFRTGWDPKLSGRKEMCESTYSGTKPMSEAETIALERFVTDLKRSEKVDALVDVHGCAQSILHPYGFTLKRPPEEKLKVLLTVANKMKSSMEHVVQKKYLIISAAQLYVAGGGLDDWAYEYMGVPLVFTLELGYASRNAFSCFHPDSDAMPLIARECFRGLKKLAQYLANSKNEKQAEEISKNRGKRDWKNIW